MSLKTRLRKLSAKAQPLIWEHWSLEEDTYTGPGGQRLNSTEFHFYKKQAPQSVGFIVVHFVDVDAQR